MNLALVAPSRESVLELEQAIRDELVLVDLPVKHYFARKAYVRELHIPKDTVLTGKIHKHSCINILLKGEMSVLTEHGVDRVKAPYIFSSPAGVKRVGFAHEDSIWVTAHGVESTSPDSVEDELIAKSFEEFDQLYAADEARRIEEK